MFDPNVLFNDVEEACEGPNLTPLIDCMVVLMAILLLLMPATRLVVADLNLAEVSSEASSAPTDDLPPVTISVLADGSLRWNGQPVGEKQIHSRLIEAETKSKSADSGPRYLIAADRDCSVGRAVQIWNQVSAAGLEAFLVATPETSTTSQSMARNKDSEPSDT